MAGNEVRSSIVERGDRAEILECVEFLRADASRKQERSRKKDLGQFFTPASIAALMASMIRNPPSIIHILDPGAGVGSLFAACVEELCGRDNPPEEILVSAYELDSELLGYLETTMELCAAKCKETGVRFTGRVFHADFIEEAVEMIEGSLFEPQEKPAFNCAILNPPYRKIRSDSETRRLLRRLGIETSNLYTAFVAVTIELLSPLGQLVAITPRSFCNGSYFRPFRELFLEKMTLDRLHVFESRTEAFNEEEVLQENVILHASRDKANPEKITITSSSGPDDELFSFREVDYNQVVHPGDPQSFIHIVPDEVGDIVAEMMGRFRHSLSDLGIQVSTGRVVDFRAEEFLRKQLAEGDAPLIYPVHFDRGSVAWPNLVGKKPNALAVTEGSLSLLVPNEPYVLVKRFSSKEEKRRVVAALCDPDLLPGSSVGIENHVNYFHRNGGGMEMDLAKGLVTFLNSSLVDSYFRQFNGHTQVNATDLRMMSYPSKVELKTLGKNLPSPFPGQEIIDSLVREELLDMSQEGHRDPVLITQRMEETRSVLKALGLPRPQQNERSALTLLALLDLKPGASWKEASNPLCGITPMMEFFRQEYGKAYAPNSRETVRRQTIHQFLDAGLVHLNPDDPQRPINSGKFVYQIDSAVLELLRTFGTEKWELALRTYLASSETLSKKYAQEREMTRIAVLPAAGTNFTLSPGGQNILVKEIVEEFAARFTPGGQLIYVGDTDEKFAHFDQEELTRLGVSVNEHGKMPDVVIYHTDKNWLVLIEAVTSHGPVNPKRRDELKRLFISSTADLVFVTAFLTRRAMVTYLNDISWETEVWVAEAPSHLIHFNGERFLGPY